VEQVPAARLKGDTTLVNLLRGAVEAASDEDGWAHLGGVGSILVKQRSDFDSRTWGYAKLSDLMTATTLFTSTAAIPGTASPLCCTPGTTATTPACSLRPDAGRLALCPCCGPLAAVH
jgi:hypothetical protein